MLLTSSRSLGSICADMSYTCSQSMVSNASMSEESLLFRGRSSVPWCLLPISVCPLCIHSDQLSSGECE